MDPKLIQALWLASISFIFLLIYIFPLSVRFSCIFFYSFGCWCYYLCCFCWRNCIFFVLESFQQSGFCDYTCVVPFNMLICPLPFHVLVIRPGRLVRFRSDGFWRDCFRGDAAGEPVMPHCLPLWDVGSCWGSCRHLLLHRRLQRGYSNPSRFLHLLAGIFP